MLQPSYQPTSLTQSLLAQIFWFEYLGMSLLVFGMNSYTG